MFKSQELKKRTTTLVHIHTMQRPILALYFNQFCWFQISINLETDNMDVSEFLRNCAGSSSSISSTDTEKGKPLLVFT